MVQMLHDFAGVRADMQRWAYSGLDPLPPVRKPWLLGRSGVEAGLRGECSPKPAAGCWSDGIV